MPWLTEAVLVRREWRGNTLLTAACNLLTLIKMLEEEAVSEQDIVALARFLFLDQYCRLELYLSVFSHFKSGDRDEEYIHDSLGGSGYRRVQI